MKYHFALVHHDQLDAIPALGDLAAETEQLVADGWIIKPPGLRDYIADIYGVRGDGVITFLLGYYTRWLINEPMNHFVLCEDRALLGLLKPEIASISEEPVSLERFRQDLIDGFITHEVTNIAPRHRALMRLVMRLNRYQDGEDISRHYELIKDQWRDTPFIYWGAPFQMNGYA